MARAYAVIGAGYGDEGKGLITDYLCAQLKLKGPVICVRHNGGGQAGHTVNTPDGQRHVFKHHGAGSFVGAHTVLAREFVVNPIIWREEQDALKEIGVDPWPVNIDRDAIVSLPMDMIINQAVELWRGPERRHGSCGYGINETVVRSQDSRLRVTVRELSRLTLEHLRWIRQQHMARRAQELGFSNPPEALRQAWDNDAVDAAFLEDVDRMVRQTEIFSDYAEMFAEVMRAEGSFRAAPRVVFEGAQGLELDQHYGEMPYVTRSNTGLANVLPLCYELGQDELEAIYVTRCYKTRHGAGPLPSELEGDSNDSWPVDMTNEENQWQGRLRYAPLDLDQLRLTVMHDWGTYGTDFYPHTKRSMSLGLTCLDQIGDGQIQLAKGDLRGLADHNQVGMELVRMFPESLHTYSSHGPTRETVRIHSSDRPDADFPRETLEETSPTGVSLPEEV